MTMPMIRDRYDVVIAGARVAGASTGMLLARQGMSVLIVDPLRRGSDTLSTHALMRGGVLQLSRWGLLDEIRDAGTPRIETTTFYYGDDSVTVPIESGHGVDGLYAPRRTVLDSILVDAAVDAGADVVHGWSATDLLRDREGRVRGVEVASRDREKRVLDADLVIGADGLRSRIAHLVGAPTVYSVPHATASIYGYVPDFGISGYHWHFGSGVAIGAIPTNDGDTCVFASLPPERFMAERDRGLDVVYREIVRAASPELAERVEAAGPPKLRAFAGVPGVLRLPVGPGWALVGDAAYFKDPLTAHGITDALRDAELLARAAEDGSERAFSAYRVTRDSLARPMMEVTSQIASFDWTMDQVKKLHLTLSREMRAEVDVMLRWDASLAVA